MLDPVRQGETARFRVTLRGDDERPIVDTYDGTEPLDLDLWLGDDAAEVGLPNSGAAWDDPAAGTILVTLSSQDTPGLSPPGYWLRLWLTDGPDRVCPVQDWLPVEPTAAEGTPLRVYGGFDAMVDEFPGIVALIAATPTLKSDLSDVRHKAALWVDRQVLARLRRDLERQGERHGYVVTVDPLVPSVGIDFGPLWGASTIPDTTLRDDLGRLKGYLDAGRVMRDDTLEEIATAQALAVLFAGQTGDEYRALAAQHARKAARRLAGYTVAIDADDDGKADLWAVP